MAKRTPKPKPRPEREVLSEIMGFLAVCHITHRRINSGMIMQSYKGRSRPVRFGAPGMADVWAVLPGGGGRTWWIETKRVGEVQTDKQREFEAEVVAAGCVYTVAYGLEDVRKVLESWRKPRENPDDALGRVRMPSEGVRTMSGEYDWADRIANNVVNHHCYRDSQPGDAPVWEDLANDIATALRSERARWTAFAGADGEPRRVLGTLPVTRDGCIAGDCAEVFITEGEDEPIAKVRLDKCGYTCTAEGFWPVGECYSTPEAAALAAKESQR